MFLFPVLKAVLMEETFAVKNSLYSLLMTLIQVCLPIITLVKFILVLMPILKTSELDWQQLKPL